LADPKTTAEQIEHYIKNPGKGMVIDGIIASEAIDTSGEILKVEGCDISSLTTDGVLNTEHRGDDANGYNFNDVIGRCVFAKKIYKASDCEDDRERMYWDQIKLPFIYGKFRLFDGAGHPSAIAAAASIRDMLHAGEDILIRFSIEGATLQRKGNVLEKSVARKVAATWKPCNKSANSGVIADPNGPPLPVRDDVVTKKEHEHPGFMKLGGEHEFRGSPILKDEGLEKGVKHALAAGALAATLATTPAQSFVREPPAPAAPAPAPVEPVKVGAQWTPVGLDNDLHPIAHLESSFGQNVHHEPHSKGEFHTAVGALGLKPTTAYEEFLHNRSLRQQHPELVTDQNSFLSTLRANPSFYNTVASSHWNRLKQSLGGHRDRAAYGWRWGKGAALSATDEEVQADPYVQKYVALAGAPQGRPGPQATMHLQKDALAAGNYDAAPGTLTGGAALMREDRAGRARSLKARRYHLNGARAALRDWDRQDDFRKFLKTRLPDADPSFIEHFSDMVDNLKLHKREADQPKPKPAKKQKPAGNKGPVMPEEFEPRAQPPDTKKVKFPPAAQPLPKPGLAPRRSNRSRVFMNENAELHTGQSVFQQSFPTEEHQGELSANVYKAILNPHDESHQHYLGDVSPDALEETVHAPWRRAMEHWMTANKLLREGKLPDSVIHHAVAFSAMSPNTPVPLQELYYGYLMDISQKFNVDISKKMSRSMLARLRQGISSGMQLPEFEREHYRSQEGSMRSEKNKERGREPGDHAENLVGADGKRLTHLDKPHPDLLSEDQRWPGHPVSDMRANDPPQIQAMTAHHTWLPHLMELVRHHGSNGREIASMLMNMKAQHEPGQSNHPTPFGFGPKLTRYALGMLGAGNVLVPDRHMIRHTFNLRLGDDAKSIAHLTQVLNNPENHHVLEAMDHHFFTKHPAVQHVLNQYPEHFKGQEDQATFPAFWLHWLTIPHHERLRGLPHEGFNGGTDHYPFWASIKNVLDKHRIAHDDTSFDFGALAKSEEERHDLLPFRTARAMHEIALRHGETAALWAYHAHILPALLSAEHADHHWVEPSPERVVHKFEAMSIELRKAVADLRKHDAMPAEPTKIKLDGKEIEPGEVAATGGERYHLVHEDPKNLFVVRADNGPEYKLQHVQRWEKKYLGEHFNVTRPLRKKSPAVVDSVEHAIPEYTWNPAQHALVHGMDLGGNSLHPADERLGNGANEGTARWMTAGNGAPAYVKSSDPYDTPQREALYHNIAHQFFGLGHYVPTTALVKHPASGRLLSVQERVQGGEHVETTPIESNFFSDGGFWDARAPHQREAITKLGDSGELDKLGLMNVLLGNEDRHPANFLYHPETGVKLIDHGHALGREGAWRIPSYLHMYHHAKNPEGHKTGNMMDRPLHPAAVKWAQSLDPQALRAAFLKHNAPHEFYELPVKRLKALREMLDRKPDTQLGVLLKLIG
jgi:hypothetical protein